MLIWGDWTNVEFFQSRGENHAAVCVKTGGLNCSVL